jgi:O-antigen ligase/polysaccharide polymerase Wzy-like membrane protein
VNRAAVLTPRAGAGYAAALAAASAGAVVLGAVAATQPRYAAALAVTGLVVAFAFRFPAAHLVVLLLATAVVPLEVQSQFGSGGDVRNAGVIPSDLLLLAGLLRAAVVLPRLPLDRRATWALALSSAFLAVVALQLLHAMAIGRGISGVGAEFRVLLALGTVLVALPVVLDSGGRARLLRGLVGLGIVLGLWGIAQFGLDLRFDPEIDTDSTATFTTAGRVVGMYAFPVAALMALSALTSGAVHAAGARLALATVVVLNLAAVVVTYERTFFLAFAAGLVWLLMRAHTRQRVRLVAWVPAVLMATVLALSVFALDVLRATPERLVSISAYQTDPSVNYREEESRLVLRRVEDQPVAGSGLGATILVGIPGTDVPLRVRRYAENGYLWLVWKLGIPGAALLLALVAAAMLGRPRARLPLERAVIVGAQAALFALAVTTIAFPSFNALSITPAIGLLVALAIARSPAGRAA